MKLQEFLALDDRGKAFTLWQYGVFLMGREVDEIDHKLYSVGEFYVEVCQGKNNVVKHINSFKSVEYLEPYLAEMSLEELVALKI